MELPMRILGEQLRTAIRKQLLERIDMTWQGDDVILRMSADAAVHLAYLIDKGVERKANERN